MPVFRGFPVEGVVAVFEEPNTIGDIEDFDAPRNGPAKNPAAHVGSVYWHSGFFQYELVSSIQSVTVNHTALNGRTQTYGGGVGVWSTFPAIVGVGQSRATNFTLVTHGLGYVPLSMVSLDGVLVCPGHPVQMIGTDGRTRSVSAYATSSIIGLREAAKSTQNTLSAVSVTYQVLVLRTPAVSSALPIFGLDGTSVVLGRGKVRTDRQYLRRVGSGDTPYVMPMGPVGDISNGRRRVVLGTTVITEPGYDGSFTGPSYITVGT